MEIISVATHTYFTFNPLLFSLGTTMIICFFAFLFAEWSSDFDGKSSGYAKKFIALLLTGLLLLGISPWAKPERVDRYEVTLDESVDMKEFMKEYKIILKTNSTYIIEKRID